MHDHYGYRAMLREHGIANPQLSDKTCERLMNDLVQALAGGNLLAAQNARKALQSSEK